MEIDKLSKKDKKIIWDLMASGEIHPRRLKRIGNHTYIEGDEVGKYVCKETGHKITYDDYLDMRDNVRTMFGIGLSSKDKKRRELKEMPDFIMTFDLGLDVRGIMNRKDREPDRLGSYKTQKNHECLTKRLFVH